MKAETVLFPIHSYSHTWYGAWFKVITQMWDGKNFLFSTIPPFKQLPLIKMNAVHTEGSQIEEQILSPMIVWLSQDEPTLFLSILEYIVLLVFLY